MATPAVAAVATVAVTAVAAMAITVLQATSAASLPLLPRHSSPLSTPAASPLRKLNCVRNWPATAMRGPSARGPCPQSPRIVSELARTRSRPARHAETLALVGWMGYCEIEVALPITGPHTVTNPLSDGVSCYSATHCAESGSDEASPRGMWASSTPPTVTEVRGDAPRLSRRRAEMRHDCLRLSRVTSRGRRTAEEAITITSAADMHTSCTQPAPSLHPACTRPHPPVLHVVSHFFRHVLTVPPFLVVTFSQPRPAHAVPYPVTVRQSPCDLR